MEDMAESLNIPSDIRSITESRFILGTDDEAARELDVDDIVAKDFDDVMRDARRYHGIGFFDPAGFRRGRPSDVDPELSFVDFDGGTLLLDGDGAPVGGYVESDLVLDFKWRDRGLGTEIVVEHFLSNGEFPTWWLDSAQYSLIGYGTHLSAHAYPATKPELYLRKLARHVILDNSEAFADIVQTMGNQRTEAALAEILTGTSVQETAAAIEAWLQERAVAPGP